MPLIDLPPNWQNAAGGLVVPEDRKGKAERTITDAVKLTIKILDAAQIASTQVAAALAPDVFKMVLHEALAE